MKKIMLLVRTLLPLLLVVGVVIAVASSPVFKPVLREPATNAMAWTTYHFTQDEKATMMSVFNLYAHIDTCRTLYLSGNISATDPADSTANMSQAFRFCRRGEELYYQLGDVEMISLKDRFITISHQAEKIIVSAPKKLVAPFQLPVDTLMKIWESENYRVKGSIRGKDSVVSLHCANHASCKEYRFVFDPSATALRELYMRMTNLDDPLNEAMDREMRIAMDTWKEGYVPDKLLQVDTYLTGDQSSWQPAGNYRHYELINKF
ncbi:hypothetical protein [Chitinophaga varians]|uniref:hypothetical protein n=1 Tax=Chitinophaga varians TaxID=2202339 RepID=UPI00165FB000|nr:hypothetical protein [Chitinophaga varians]MBC9914059.1 hypothetical protein [Chitinophaga varians]